MKPWTYVFTGFEPFGKLDYNPSWDVAATAAEMLGAQAHLLPVDFETAAEASELLEEGVCLIHIGVASARSTLDFERYAHNATGPYEALETHGLMSLDPAGPVARASELPLTTWVENWADEIPAKESRDAGIYVCNATYFHSLARVERLRAAGASAACAFIHVPWISAPEAQRLGQELARVLG